MKLRVPVGGPERDTKACFGGEVGSGRKAVLLEKKYISGDS